MLLIHELNWHVDFKRKVHLVFNAQSAQSAMPVVSGRYIKRTITKLAEQRTQPLPVLHLIVLHEILNQKGIVRAQTIFLVLNLPRHVSTRSTAKNRRTAFTSETTQTDWPTFEYISIVWSNIVREKKCMVEGSDTLTSNLVSVTLVL